MQEAFAGTPSGWERQNVQIVLKTQVVGGTAGPPNVATHFW
jgi:hypothetical protein